MKWLLRGTTLFCITLIGLCAMVVLRAQRVSSTQTPETMALSQKDVSYGANAAQKLDVWQPPIRSKAPRAAIILVHGGAWVAGDKNDLSDWSRDMAQSGFVCFNLNYRLSTATENRYPSQLDDVQRAVRWVRAHAAFYNIDPKRIGALGTSAGGHLVALLGTQDTRDNSDKTLAAFSSRVQCVVDLFGPTDFTAPSPLGLDLDVEHLLQQLFGGTRAQMPQQYRDASPLYHIDKRSAPFLIFHGGRDKTVPIDQSRRFDKALREAGIESQLVVYPDEGHGFQQAANNKDFAARALAFLQRHLKS